MKDPCSIFHPDLSAEKILFQLAGPSPKQLDFPIDNRVHETKHGYMNAWSKCERTDKTFTVAPRLPVLPPRGQVIHVHRDVKEICHVN